MSGVSGVSRASRVFAVLDLDSKKQTAFSLAWQAGEKACSFWGDGDLSSVGQSGRMSQVSIIGWEYFNPTTFPKNAVGELISGRSCLVVHGFVEYGDIFGSPAKTLKFCKVLLEYGSIPSNCVASDCDNCRPVDE